MNSNIVPKPLDYVKYLYKLKKYCKEQNDQYTIDIIVDGITDNTRLRLDDVLVDSGDHLLYLNKMRLGNDSSEGTLKGSLRGLRFLSRFVERWKNIPLGIEYDYLRGNESLMSGLMEHNIESLNVENILQHFNSIGALLPRRTNWIIGKNKNDMVITLEIGDYKYFPSKFFLKDSLEKSYRNYKIHRLDGRSSINPL